MVNSGWIVLSLLPQQVLVHFLKNKFTTSGRKALHAKVSRPYDPSPLFHAKSLVAVMAVMVDWRTVLPLSHLSVNE